MNRNQNHRGRAKFLCDLAMLATLGFAACQSTNPTSDRPFENSPDETGGNLMGLSVTSSAFADGAAIPARYSADGEDVSPPLRWAGIPKGTKEMVLMVDDPDAPTADPWVHWLIYKIPATETGLAENIPKTSALSNPTGSVQGKNSWGTTGYRGPSPPRGSGVHHYHFKLYALDAALPVGAGLDKNQLLAAISGHVLAQGEIVGTYRR